MQRNITRGSRSNKYNTMIVAENTYNYNLRSIAQ